MKKNIIGIAMILAVSGIGLAGMSAYAQTDMGQQMRDAHALGSSLEVHINDNGSVLVRGAKVTSVSNGTIYATTAWTSTNMNWAIITNANTEFINRLGGRGALGNVAAGDFVSFSGTLTAGNSGTFTVNAGAVKDWSQSVINGTTNVKTTVQGIVQLPPVNSSPSSFVLKVNGVNYTVRIANDTSILNVFWLRTGFANIRAGDTVRVYGMINSDQTIDATVVRDISIRL